MAEHDGDEHRDSHSHLIAVTRQDNGELAEDVISKEVVEDDGSTGADANEVPNGQHRPRVLRQRVVTTGPAPEAPARDRPDDPVPGSLPSP
jgi:hypothetical protein